LAANSGYSVTVTGSMSFSHAPVCLTCPKGGCEPALHKPSARPGRSSGLVRAALRPGGKQKIDDEERNSNVNRRISQVKDEKMPPKCMQVEKIDHRAVDKAIDGVA